MLNFFKRKASRSEIREMLFGDLPMSLWPNEALTPDSEPWMSFAKAREHLNSGNTQGAVDLYKSILAMPKLESRHYVQVWHFLRETGVEPDVEVAKDVFGVVAEITLRRGLDIVAAYADGTARYFNHRRSAVIWNAPDDSLRPQIESVLKAGRTVAEKIGPWERPRPDAPPVGQARISMLTPSGLHFGQAPTQTLAADELGSVVFSAVMQLMKSLILKTKEKKD